MSTPRLGEKQVRTFAIELDRSAPDTGDGGIPVTLSSELPVERGFGKEVLDHSAQGVDLSYARDGLPFLMNHDTDHQIGIIRDLALNPETRRMTGRLYPGNHPDASWVFADIRGGIRPNVSVGYALLSVMERTKDNKTDVYRFRWAPMEGSTVPVPADITVGIGRSADEAATPEAPLPSASAPQAKESRMSEQAAANGAANTRTDNPTPSVVDVSVTRGAAADILTLAAQNGVEMEHAADAIRRGVSVGDFAKEILTHNAGRSKPVTAPAQAAPLDISERERSRNDFSFVRAIDAQVKAAEGKREPFKDAGFEREVSTALTKVFGREPQGGGFFAPTWMGTRVTGQLAVATTSQGAELKFIEPGSFIELLRNRMMVAKAGATFLSGLQGDIAFPRQTGAGTFTWNGEAPAATDAVALSHLTLDQLSLAPKTGQSASSISRRLLVQSVVGAEDLVRRDIALVHALAMDLAAINGSGANNQPKGILQNTSIGSVTMGAAGAAATYAKIVELETTIANSNADYGALAYLTNPTQRGTLKTTQVFATTNGMPVWTGGVEDGEMNGYRAFATKQVPSNLTKGTSTTICSAIIFGNFNELIIGEWGTMEVIVDPYTLATRNLIQLVSVQMIDVGLRHAASFAAIQDAL